MGSEQKTKGTLFDIVLKTLRETPYVEVKRSENYPDQARGTDLHGEVEVRFRSVEKRYLGGLFTRAVPGSSMPKVYEGIKASDAWKDHRENHCIQSGAHFEKNTALFTADYGSQGKAEVVITEAPGV